MRRDARLELHQHRVKTKEQAVDEDKVLRHADIAPLHRSANIFVEFAAKITIAKIECIALVGFEHKAAKLAQKGI